MRLAATGFTYLAYRSYTLGFSPGFIYFLLYAAGMLLLGFLDTCECERREANSGV